MEPLSLIIPTLNEEAYLPRLLQSIVDASKRYDSPIQVIVVDGKSNDKTLAVTENYQEQLPTLEIYSSRRGISIQRNLGAEKARYETIVFLDADMELTKDSLKSIGAQRKDKAHFIAMPLIYPYDGKLIDFILGTMAYTYFYVFQRFSPVISGMCIVTTKTVHKKIGGFDENIKHGEDIDYGLRAVKAGARHYIFLDVRVRASARRLNRDGRVKTGLAWLRWHQKARKDRRLLYERESNYSFGEFS